ncbi:MAG: UDP-glucose 6-dehydrogenase [Rickettsiales bacterium]|nr:UDP-glucose 6-dehydrogenase [Rickettsiales bacterium]
MQLTIVGTGYVGLVSGTCFADTGNDVVCLDVDEVKVEMMRRGESPIYEPGLSDLLERNIAAGRLTFTTDAVAAYQDTDFIFICVGTPSDDEGRADLQYVLGVAEDIGRILDAQPEPAPGARGPIVVVKSTVPVGTNDKVRAAISAQTSRPFSMASNPEFLKEGAAIHDFYKPDRVVVGCDDERTAAKMRRLYEPYVRQGNPILVMDIRSAEMVKYASNAMLATKISFINEIASLCEAYGAEIGMVRKGMCSDQRIGNQFLYPGLGYGGSCFPKDVLACISMGIDQETPTKLLSAVHRVNQDQRGRFIAKIDEHFSGQVKGLRFAVWGLAFKPRTDDMRGAPSLDIIRWLLERGASVVAFDPVAMDRARQELDGDISYVVNDLDALDGADALVICTEWPEFRRPDFSEMRGRMSGTVIFDGRNIYSLEMMREHGFSYYSVGRRPQLLGPVAADTAVS